MGELYPWHTLPHPRRRLGTVLRVLLLSTSVLSKPTRKSLGSSTPPAYRLKRKVESGSALSQKTTQKMITLTLMPNLTGTGGWQDFLRVLRNVGTLARL